MGIGHFGFDKMDSAKWETAKWDSAIWDVTGTRPSMHHFIILVDILSVKDILLLNVATELYYNALLYSAL